MRSMDKPLLVIGYRWTPHTLVMRVRPVLDAGPVTEIPLQGEVAFAIGRRRCIGHRDGDESVPCPGLRGLERGRQCPSCQLADTFRPCMTCDGSRCPRLVPAAQRNCRGTHHLYLADFGAPYVKVGTAADERRDARLHDQGPLAALRVAAGPGPRIKQIERFASTHTELVEAFRRDRKRNLLRSRMTPHEARERLWDALADLQDAGPPHPDLFGVPHQVVLPELQLQTRNRITHQQELPIQPDSVVRGTVLGAVGGVVLLEEAHSQVLVDIGDLVGFPIDPDPPADLPPPRMQLGLF